MTLPYTRFRCGATGTSNTGSEHSTLPSITPRGCRCRAWCSRYPFYPAGRQCVMLPAPDLQAAPPQRPLSGFPSGLTGHLGSLEAPQVLDGHLQNVGLLQLGMPGALREQAGLRPARQRRLPPHPPPRPPCAYILLQCVQDERLQLP